MEQSEHLNFRYVKDDGYRIVSASGVHGGVTPDSHVIAHFFFDLRGLPETVIQQVTTEGKLGAVEAAEEGAPGGPWFERRLSVGVVMSADRARSIGEWLIAQAAQAEEARQAREESQ